MSGRKWLELAVESGWHDRLWCPVKCEIAPLEGVSPGELRLRDVTSGVPVPLQVQVAKDGRWELSWIVEEMERLSQRTYELVTEGKPPEARGVTLEESPGLVKVRVGGQLFTTYHFGPDVVRPYLYPILASGGVGITRSWPMEDRPGDTHDHPHHKGLWTAHGDVNGVDNWSEMPGHGYMVHRRFTQLYSGPVLGGFTQELDWTDAEGRKVLTETRRVTFYNTPARARIFDWEVTLQASEGEVVLADTKEAGLISVRVATPMDARGEGLIENGYGARQEAETWGKRAPWCDYSGPVGGLWRGICLMDHLDNPRHPTHWHVRDYGLMTANCFGLHDFTGDPENRWDLIIPAGESRTWRYRVLIHEGDAQEGRVAVHYHGYVHPPQVTVK